MTDTLFYKRDPKLHTQTDAPVIAIKHMETGYWPIHTSADPDSLNPPGTTPDILESALLASAFGWHIPGAKPARDFFESMQ